MFDEDGSGEIDATELGHAMRNMGVVCTLPLLVVIRLGWAGAFLGGAVALCTLHAVLFLSLL